MTLGYCLNVHPGETLDEVVAALEGPVAKARQLAGEIGVGIYLAASAVREVEASARAFTRLERALDTAGVRAFTANAFPFGGFHAESVKTAVYRPTWEEPARRDFTIAVARVLARLLPRGGRGSLSTLPLGHRASGTNLSRAGALLGEVAVALERISWEQERELALAIEPEPFCVIERASELVRFLEENVFAGEGRAVIARELPGLNAEAIARRRIGACLDACHHAVVFEEIEDALRLYDAAGVRIVKAQLSSALLVRDVEKLRPFAEPRYLHQTFWKRGAELGRAEDIEPALEAARGATEVRSHFHVPLAWAGDAEIGTTRPLLERALPAIARATTDLEVETYTWSVLPEA
ncbi:MAG: metabolite traffic protein EboE, partial [Planctomycetota bacterium]